MDFSPSERQLEWLDRTKVFIKEHVEPAAEKYEEQLQEGDRWKVIPVMTELKEKAKAAGLWNMFMPPSEYETDEYHGAGLTNLEYALCCEQMGRSEWAPEVFNCKSPDTGNMEVLLRYGSDEQKKRWLRPLMDGDIRSAFLMTEPAVASSDATNIETSIRREGGEYVINGRKWWSTGVGNPLCKVAILMGKTDPDAATHSQQSMILVPMDTPGVKVERLLPVFGFDDAPYGHGQVVLDNVRVPAENLLLGEGRGFEIAQGRLGPGRIHHCMRAIGKAEVALEAMIKRLESRVAFNKPIIQHSVWDERIARARSSIDMSRLLVLNAADEMDKVGNKAARMEIAMIKVVVPKMALRIIDDAIQAWGGAGVTTDSGLARAYSLMRVLRISDGPDEVHNRTISRLEVKRQSAP